MLRVWIGGWRHVEHLDPAKSHTVYQVEVTTQTGNYYRVERRYSAFHSLNKQCKKSGFHHLAEFPPKRIRNTSAKVLESRRKGLEHFIQSLARVSPTPPLLLAFLELPDSAVNNEAVNNYNTQVMGYCSDPYLGDSDESTEMSDMITQGKTPNTYKTIYCNVMLKLIYFSQPLWLPSMDEYFQNLCFAQKRRKISMKRETSSEQEAFMM